jgi:hypothetical protein
VIGRYEKLPLQRIRDVEGYLGHFFANDTEYYRIPIWVERRFPGVTQFHSLIRQHNPEEYGDYLFLLHFVEMLAEKLVGVDAEEGKRRVLSAERLCYYPVGNIQAVG